MRLHREMSGRRDQPELPGLRLYHDKLYRQGGGTGGAACSGAGTGEKVRHESGCPALVVALLGGGGALYYFKFMKNKPKTKGADNLDDYDYGDEEDELWESEEGAEEEPEESEEEPE